MALVIISKLPEKMRYTRGTVAQVCIPTNLADAVGRANT